MAAVSDNKQIAKNTLYLYLRMIVLLVVGLYTSRVTLIALGISDYGIFNVVGGIVSMFVFINYAMINSTQRYITYELGRKDQERLSLIFSTSMNIHAVISFVIILLSETIGLWFLYHKMVIPADRMNAAFWVFQFSIVACFVNIMCVPYNALIIAHEKMSAFAYISLLDAGFKLGIVYLLLISDGDRLILYGFLTLIVTIIDIAIYIAYCRRNFPESEYHYIVDKPLTVEMTKFASWNLLGNLSYVCYTQGLNLLLNVFFNPIVNAARGIAVQIQTVVSNFSYNIENAIKPQITKSYSQDDLSRMHTLIFVSARMSFFALLLVSFPILLETKQILDLWLAEVPDHTVNFVRLTILLLLIDSLANPLLTAAQATGNMKTYQMTVSLLCFFILPCSYLALLIWNVPEIVFVVNIIISLIVQIVKLLIVGKQVQLSISVYCKHVFVRAFAVLGLACALTIPFLYLLDETLFRLFALAIFSCLVVIGLVWTVGINTSEREVLRQKAVSFINQKIKKCP